MLKRRGIDMDWHGGREQRELEREAAWRSLMDEVDESQRTVDFAYHCALVAVTVECVVVVVWCIVVLCGLC